MSQFLQHIVSEIKVTYLLFLKLAVEMSDLGYPNSSSMNSSTRSRSSSMAAGRSSSMVAR